MSFFRKTVTLQVRSSPAEVERRLQRIVRKPRTLFELLRRVPANPPEHPDFIGIIENGKFRLNRLADVASSVGRFHSQRPNIRGTITQTGTGSELTIEFFDPGLCALILGLSMGVSLTTLAITGGWPIWRLEHVIVIIVVASSLWAYGHSLKEDVKATKAIICACLNIRQ